mmetsp:Transcript_80942/g.203649  ORF Transcript_80942/g.203649 Transcript_80942/m.203649 type:complete len:560 (-) Transcript_80942:863-2542(-)
MHQDVQQSIDLPDFEKDPFLHLLALGQVHEIRQQLRLVTITDGMVRRNAILHVGEVRSNLHRAPRGGREDRGPPGRAPEAGLVLGLVPEMLRRMDLPADRSSAATDFRFCIIKQRLHSLLDGSPGSDHAFVGHPRWTAKGEDRVHQGHQDDADNDVDYRVVRGCGVNDLGGALLQEVLRPEGSHENCDASVGGRVVIHEECEAHPKGQEHGHGDVRPELAPTEDRVGHLPDDEPDDDALEPGQVFFHGRARKPRQQDRRCVGDARRELQDHLGVAVEANVETEEDCHRVLDRKVDVCQVEEDAPIENAAEPILQSQNHVVGLSPCLVEIRVAHILCVLDRDAAVAASRKAESMLRQQLLADFGQAGVRFGGPELRREGEHAATKVLHVRPDPRLLPAALGGQLAAAGEAREAREEAVRALGDLLHVRQAPGHDADVGRGPVLDLASSNDARQPLPRLLAHSLQPVQHLPHAVHRSSAEALPPGIIDVACQGVHRLAHLLVAALQLRHCVGVWMVIAVEGDCGRPSLACHVHQRLRRLASLLRRQDRIRKQRNQNGEQRA